MVESLASVLLTAQLTSSLFISPSRWSRDGGGGGAKVIDNVEKEMTTTFPSIPDQ